MGCPLSSVMMKPFRQKRRPAVVRSLKGGAAAGLLISSVLLALPLLAQNPQPAPTPVPSPLAKPIPPLAPFPAASVPAMDEQLWQQNGRSGDRAALLKAIDYSLRYLATEKAAQTYRSYRVPGVTRDRVVRSLRRFRQLVVAARSPAALEAAVQREFVFYRSVGSDTQGTVAFTGYFEPVHPASRVPTKEFRYPLFRVPPDFASWRQPHPTRSQLEGANGLQFRTSRLKGLELVWLRDRLDAFLIQVQGSARLRLADGTTMTVGYAGNTNYPYTGIGRELVKAGKFTLEELTLPRLKQYFRENPAELDVYIPRNDRFVFFRETGGAPATGSLGVPVTAERSIATDKSLFPPGALALIRAQLPYTAGNTYGPRQVNRFVLDQDTGGAIRGAGRVDVYMGTGQQAEDRAGLINSTGELYYLLLRE